MRARCGAIVAAAAVALTGCGRVGFDPPAGEIEATYTGSWLELGGSATGGGISNLPGNNSVGTIRVQVGPDGRPMVAWTDDTSGAREVYLRAWDGAAWAELGGSASGGGISSGGGYCRAGGLAIGPDSAPCVSWTDDLPSMTLLVKCWTGSAWIGLDGSDTGVTTAGDPWWPQLVFDDDRLIVLWEEYGTVQNGAIYLRRHDTTGWSELGGSASAGGISGSIQSRSATIASRDGALWAVFGANDTSDIYATTWTGTTWSGVAGSDTGSGVSATTAPSLRPVVAIGAAPIAVWMDDADPVTEVGSMFLRVWDGSAWVELGGSASGAGIPAMAPPAFYPSVAVGRDGEPIVLALRGDDAFVARWDGATWTNPGSQTASGVSASGNAAWPELAVAADGTIYVAWMHTLPNGSAQLYLRYLPPDPEPS